MKLIRALQTIVIGLCLSLQLQAQIPGLSIVEVSNNGANLDVKLRVNADTAFILFTSNFVVQYTTNPSTGVLGTPTLLTPHNYYGGNYGSASNWFTTPLNGRVSINPVMTGNQTTNNVALTPSWSDIATVRFPILDTGTVSFQWRVSSNGRTYIFSYVSPNNYWLPMRFGGIPDTSGLLTYVNLGGPAPVELTSFTGNLIGKSVKLRWNTATEINSHGFKIERSVNKNDWQEIGLVLGQGVSNTPHDYTFVDDNLPGSNILFYRLNMVDRDGTNEYSNVVQVQNGAMPTSAQLYKTYPNPFNPSATVHFSIPSEENVTVAVYDGLGREVMRLYDNEPLKAGYYSKAFNSQQLASGTYVVRMTAGSFKANESIVLQK